MIDEYSMEDLGEYKAQSKKWLFDIVRQYIIDNKIRNWGEHMPKYDEIDDNDDRWNLFHYYSDILKIAFKENDVPQNIINEIDIVLNKYTRVGDLRLHFEDPKCHFVINLSTIKMVIDKL